MIQIGEAKFNTRRPADLDGALIASTGCSALETQRWLQGSPLPARIAAALAPWLSGDEVPDVATLGKLIADSGVADVAGQVATLYASLPDAPAE